MKTYKYYLSLFITIFCLILSSKLVYANEIMEENKIVIEVTDYESPYYNPLDNSRIQRTLSDFEFDLWISKYDKQQEVDYFSAGDRLYNYCLNGTITNKTSNYTYTLENEPIIIYPFVKNYYVITEGEQTINCKYSPARSIHGIDLFYYSITFVANNEVTETIIDISQYTKNINPIELLEDNLPPTLSANNIILDIGTKYDINIENKIKDTTYNWISDNEEIVTVNSKNGVINAISEGTAIITCQMTNGAEISTLSATVNVIKYDDKYPTLTETELELETDDFFDINITNKIKGSKYYWTSSDKTIAKVNSKHGKVTTISEGDVKITCIITTPDNQVFVRKCDVSVVNYSKFEENDVEE